MSHRGCVVTVDDLVFLIFFFPFAQGQHKVEGAWQHRKLRLHQRLQLCVFQQDVRQVWPAGTTHAC